MSKKLYFIFFFNTFIFSSSAAVPSKLDKIVLIAKVNPEKLDSQELSSALKFFAQNIFGIYINPEKIDLKNWDKISQNKNRDIIIFQNLLKSAIKLLNNSFPEFSCFSQAQEACKKEDQKIPTIFSLYQDLISSIDRLQDIFKLEKTVKIENFLSILSNLQNKLGIFKRELTLIKSTKENSEYKSLLNNILDIYLKITEKIKEDFVYPKLVVLKELEDTINSILNLDLTKYITANFRYIWHNLIDKIEFFVNTNNSKDFPIIFNKYIKELEYDLIDNINNLSNASYTISGNAEKDKVEKYQKLYYFLNQTEEKIKQAWWQVKSTLTINKGPGEIKDVLSSLINNTAKIVQKIKSEWVYKLGPLPRSANKAASRGDIIPKARDLYKQEEELAQEGQE